MHRVPIALLLWAGTARADVGIELAGGAGNDSATDAGYATASASFSAELDHAEAPLVARGIFVPNATPDEARAEPFYAWVLTGLDRDERMSAGVAGTGELHVLPDRMIGVASGRAWGRAYGWKLEGRVEVQPVGDLRDPFWRPGRDVVQWNTALDVPALWALGSARTQVLAGLVQLDLGHRRVLVDGNWQAIGWDRSITFTTVRMQRPAVVLDAFVFGYAELGAARSRVGDTEYGTSATTIDFDVAAATLRLTDNVELAGHVGFSDQMPVGPYMLTGTSESSTGTDAMTATYWAEVRRTSETQHAVLGAGSWSRLDPTGHAADAGHLLAASGDRRWRTVVLAGKLQVGRLNRLAIADLAPASLAPIGTTMWMGRGEVSATVAIAHGVDLTGGTWLERSDRDDPRWTVPASSAVATHAGAEVSARWRFHR